LNPIEILISEIEHTGEQCPDKETQEKLEAHLRQYGEAVMKERDEKPPGRWNVAEVKLGVEETWVRLTETQYVADEPWPKVGQILEEERS
jgi:hypothetical protein